MPRAGRKSPVDDPIIPEIALSAAESGQVQKTIVKKSTKRPAKASKIENKKSRKDAEKEFESEDEQQDEEVEYTIDQSPDKARKRTRSNEELNSEKKKDRQPQISEYFKGGSGAASVSKSADPSSSTWEHIHTPHGSGATEKKQRGTKVVMVDIEEVPPAGNVSAVLEEVDCAGGSTESAELQKNIDKARRSNIKFQFESQAKKNAESEKEREAKKEERRLSKREERNKDSFFDEDPYANMPITPSRQMQPQSLSNKLMTYEENCGFEEEAEDHEHVTNRRPAKIFKMPTPKSTPSKSETAVVRRTPTPKTTPSKSDTSLARISPRIVNKSNESSHRTMPSSSLTTPNKKPLIDSLREQWLEPDDTKKKVERKEQKPSLQEATMTRTVKEVHVKSTSNDDAPMLDREDQNDKETTSYEKSTGSQNSLEYEEEEPMEVDSYEAGPAKNEGDNKQPKKDQSPEIDYAILYEDDMVEQYETRAFNNELRYQMILDELKTNEAEYKEFPDVRKPLPESHSCFIRTNTVDGIHIPKPYPSVCEDYALKFGILGYVKLPFSNRNFYNGTHRHAMIREGLAGLINQDENVPNFAAIVQSFRYCGTNRKLAGLERYWNATPVANGDRLKLWKTIQGIARLAMRTGWVITAPIPLLTKNRPTKCVILSQLQCACLLALAFFGTFHYQTDDNRMLGFNFRNYILQDYNIYQTKLKFMLTYFEKVLENMPIGFVSFRRQAGRPKTGDEWSQSTEKLATMAIRTEGTIEDAAGCLQVDFANEYIGGGVLNTGAVQEEIRFLMCPEMMVSMMLCERERMQSNEAIFISGAQRYSSYAGYGSSFEWRPYNNYGKEPKHRLGNINTELVAIDALNFATSRRNRESQFEEEKLLRELNKACVGFTTATFPLRPVATGNWGCGVFEGDKQLKAMIQLLAASYCGRSVLYYTFHDNKFTTSLDIVYKRLIQKEVTCGELYNLLATKPQNVRLFDHLMKETKNRVVAPPGLTKPSKESESQESELVKPSQELFDIDV